MDNQPLLDVSGHDSLARRDEKPNLRSARPQYIDAPASEIIDEPGPSLIFEYWHILRRHKGALLLIALLGFLASLLFTILQTPHYQARASLEIQSLNQNFLNMREVSPTADDSGTSLPEYDLQTQAKILQSDSVLEGVIAKLNLEKELSLKETGSRLSTWRRALGLAEASSDTTHEEALSLAHKNLTIQIEPNTRVVDILYDSTDPQLAAGFVNSLIAEFVQQNREARWKTAQQTGEWLTHQMEDVRIKLEKSEDDLQNYSNASGLLFTAGQDSVAVERLRELQDELSKAQADRVAMQSKYELVTSQSPESLPEVLDDPTLKDYQVKLTDLRRQLAEISSALTPSHPAVKKVQAQVTALELSVVTQRANIIQRIRNEFESARRREALLSANYASQARLVSEQAAEVTHYNILKREVDSNRELYDSMLRSVQETSVTSALKASNIRVIDSAGVPAHPYKPSIVLNSTLGLFVGAFFGIAFVVVRERSDRSIRTPGEAELYLGLPELGVIPSAKAEQSRLLAPYKNGKGRECAILGIGKRPMQVELVTSQLTPSVLADSFRATLTSILLSGENGARPRIVVLASANSGEGKTTVASNLGLALAEIGQPTLLIDGDLRRPRLHEIFAVPNEWGLSDLLQAKSLPKGREREFLKTGHRDLFVLPAGSASSRIPWLLHSPRAVLFLNQMRQEFHTIIIDTPPMLQVPDARIFGHLADGVILVVRSAQTMREAAASAKQRLIEDGSRVLGTVLNEWDPRETSHGGYAYAYGYAHYPPSRPGSR
jgi:capsular exopolysaccharide synthesis family protein